MTKIIFVLSIYEIGGASTVARNLMDCLETDKFEIVLLTQKLADRHYPICNNVKLVNLDIIPHAGVLAKILNIMRNIRSIRRCIAAEAPDTVLSFSAQANCYMLLSMLFLAGKKPKIIISEHSEEMFLKMKGRGIKYNVFKSIYRILMWLLYHKADYIIAVSNNIAHRIKKILLVSPSKVRVIYSPININRIRKLCAEEGLGTNFNNSLPYIGTVSRLSPEKGVHFLIQAFRGILDKMDARLIIVGDGAERERLEQLAKDLHIEEKIIFTGEIYNPFIYLVRMDIFVLPSLWEGFPMVVLEAMACRVPIIASDSTESLREAIKNGVNGVLIKPASPSAISESVYDLLSQKEKRERIIEEAFKRVKQFDIEVVKKEYESLISS